MTENPQAGEDSEKENEKQCPEEEKREPRGAWSEDRKKRGYYYDDAHGYEVYNPDDDEETAGD